MDNVFQIKQPNTDDDTPIDIEQILSTRIHLSDGSDSYLFSRGPKYNDELWPIQCHLCRVGYMVNEKKLRSHLKSEKHVANLKAGPPKTTDFLAPYDQLYSDRLHLVNPITIYPGEIIYEVTTSMADRLIKIRPYNWDVPPKAEVIEILNKDPIYNYNASAPVIGICYLFKYFNNGLINYRCSLCDCILYEDGCYQHLVSVSHINSYIDEHFPCTKKALNGMMGLVSQETKIKYIIEVIRYIYHKLEQWKGCREFNLIDAKSIEHQYPRFLTRIKKIIHYDENIVKFSDDELSKFLQTLRSGQNLLPAPLDKLPNQKTKEEIQKLKDENSKKRKINDRPEPLPIRVKRDKKTAERISSLGLDDSVETWAKYRDLSEKTIFDLNKEYGQFMDMAENHPRYSEEWNKFWMMRCNELRRDNIDPERYNFTNEWNRYWISYMEDCYEKDVERCKFELRKKLKLPFRPRTPSPVRRNENTIRGFNNNSGGNTSSIPSLLSLPPLLGGLNNQQQPIPLYGGTGAKNIGDIGGGIGMTPDSKPSEPLSVLSVLRLLTVLEDQLGSLGPTAIQLLSKAIFFEKETKNSANELLNETDYFSLFVTSLEKLRGQLMTNIVPSLKLSVVKNAVHDLDQILTLFEEYKRRTGKLTAPLKRESTDLKYVQMNKYESLNDNWSNKPDSNSNRNWDDSFNQSNRRIFNRYNTNNNNAKNNNNNNNNNNYNTEIK